eukprot:TRINITY_DN4352_c0_g1_i2.p3 TRINITY_DN4352_c0_g1~~TRINITY_DN4352_c0_g1_i2.p3  ORF type:complete len:130 (-),score=40.30 TRINITY_DN4352_c0_g1_i2:549-938(-)
MMVHGLREEVPDREITQVSIKKAQIVGDQSGPVVLYQVDLRNDYREWTVLKRFKAFKQLEEDLLRLFGKTAAGQQIPRLPQRKLKLFVDHVDRVFIEERRQALETFCNELLALPQVANHDLVLQFFLSI